MPGQKRSRKQYTRPRRTTRRTRARTMRRGPPRMMNTLMPHKFVRMYAGVGSGGANTITGAAGFAPYVSNFTVNLAGVVNSTEFGNLFDQYRITYCVVKHYLKVDPSAQAAATANYPKLFWYRDYDDSATPTINEIRENTKCRVAILRPDRPIVWKFKPNTLRLMYQSGVTNQFSPTWGAWLDCSTLTTPHYGFKYAIDDFTNTNYKLETEVKVYFECRQPR